MASTPLDLHVLLFVSAAKQLCHLTSALFNSEIYLPSSGFPGSRSANNLMENFALFQRTNQCHIGVINSRVFGAFPLGFVHVTY